MFPGSPRIECSKTPEQIRDEAAKATAADLAALYDACGIAPSCDVKLQVAAQIFWRHREEIQGAATTVHFPVEDAADRAAKVTH